MKAGIYCNTRNVKKETFDAMLAVAHAHGFDVTGANIGNYFQIIGHDRKVVGRDTLLKLTRDFYKEISVNDWLFSLAPDSATCMFRMADTKELKYGDGESVTYSLHGVANMYHVHSLDEKNPSNVLNTLIATRGLTGISVTAAEIEAKSKRDMVTLKITDLPLPVHFRGMQQPISPAPPAVQAPRVRLGLFEVVYEDDNVMVLVNEQNANYYTIMKDWGITIDQATEADIKIFNQLYRLGVADLNEHHYEALKALHELGE